MKLIIRAIVTTCIAGVIFLTIMAVSGRMNRSMELKSNLPSTVEETAENLLTKKYNVTDKNQLEADFLETLAYAIDSDSDGNRGIVKIIAAHMNTDGTDYNAYTDYGAYQTEIAKDAPVIEYHGSGSLAPGTVNVADYVKAHDYNGQELAVKLLKFCDKDGNELTDQMDQASGTITFSSAGKYSFTVKAVDSGNRKTTAVIRVPVM